MPKDKPKMEGDVYFPSNDVVAQANILDWDETAAFALKDLEGFWADHAEELEWFQRWDKVLDDSNKPFFKWFTGAKFNIVHNCLDRHMNTPVKDKIAYIYESEPGEVERWTFEQLHKEVNKFANGLKKLGVKKGDRVTLFMPMIPQNPVAMLACAKIGAVHSVVFSGFSSGSLRDRILDADSKVLVTTDGAYRRGKVVELKKNADAAMAEAPCCQHCIVFKRAGNEVEMKEGRDVWWHELIDGVADECAPEPLDSEDMLYMLYTSGTTGKPKGIVHIHGGYAVGTYSTLKFVFDLKPDDVWWCAADIGWVTGHSYIVYAPLMNGATSILYEGAPDFPAPDRWWSIVEREKVTVL